MENFDTENLTTGQLRKMARIEADRLHWADAADLMEMAIRRYPPASALGEADKALMQARVNSWRHQAKEK